MSTNNSKDQAKLSFVRYLVVAVFYLVLTLYFYSFSKYGFNVWDEGGFAYGTLRTLNGQKALKDFNPEGYPPGRYIYAGFFFKQFGISVQSLRMSVVLITPGMILMVYGIARKLMPPGFSVLAALCMLSAPATYYSRFYPFFCVLNLYCLVELMEKKRIRNLFLLAGSAILSLFFKVEVGLFTFVISGVLLSLMLLNTSRLAEIVVKPAFRIFVFVATVVVSATVIYFLRHNSVEKIVFMVFKVHGVWGNPFPDIFPFQSTLAQIGRHEMFERILFYLPIWTYAMAGILLIVRVFKGDQAIWASNLYLAAVLMFGVCAFGLVIWRAGFDNLLRTLPPFYILFCYLLFLVRNKCLQALASQGPHASFLWLKKEITEFLILFLPLTFIYEMNVNHGFYAGTVGAVKFERTRLQMDRIDIYTSSQEADWLKRVVDRIKKHTQKGDPILALPLNPIFYFLTDRINPTQYDWILPGMLDKEKESLLVEQLRANIPKMVIFVDIAIDGKEERRLSSYAPVLFKFIADNYLPLETVGFFQLLTLNKSYNSQQQAPDSGVSAVGVGAGPQPNTP